MSKWICAVAGLAFALSTHAGMARPVAQSAPMAQALANVKAEQRQRMRNELRTSWSAMSRQVAQTRVAQQKPAGNESETVKSSP